MITDGNKMVVEAVLFDLDGTLIDSIGVYFKIVDIVFEKLKLPPVRREQIGEATKDGDFDWRCVLPDHMKDRTAELEKKAMDIIYEIYPRMFGKDLKLIPGADLILREISSDGMKIGIVTSTPEEGMRYKMQVLDKAGLQKLIDVVITADDVTNKKPAAEPLVKCSKRLGIAPKRCVYVGDTRLDIKAGKAAAMKTIGVLTGFDGRTALGEQAPDAIIQSVTELPNVIAFNKHLI